jgi:hypothetical protein
MVDEIKHSIDTSNNISVETLKIHLHNKQIRMGPMLMGSRATARRAHALRRHCIDYLSNTLESYRSLLFYINLSEFLCGFGIHH